MEIVTTQHSRVCFCRFRVRLTIRHPIRHACSLHSTAIKHSMTELFANLINSNVCFRSCTIYKQNCRNRLRSAVVHEKKDIIPSISSLLYFCILFYSILFHWLIVYQPGCECILYTVYCIMCYVRGSQQRNTAEHSKQLQNCSIWRFCQPSHY